jgi:hypothetical protein
MYRRSAYRRYAELRRFMLKGCASSWTMMWSTHPRRIDPISRAAKPFCQGEAGAKASNVHDTRSACEPRRRRSDRGLAWSISWVVATTRRLFTNVRFAQPEAAIPPIQYRNPRRAFGFSVTRQAGATSASPTCTHPTTQRRRGKMYAQRLGLQAVSPAPAADPPLHRDRHAAR